MRNVSRRKFLVRAAGAAGCLPLSNWLKADPLGMPIGFQIYGVREEASKDLAGILKQVAAFGYKRVELCSFPGYANSGFGPLASMKPEDVRKTIEDTGMRGESCHFQFREYEPAMIDQSIAYAKALGLKYMIMSSPKEGARNPNVTMDQWKWNFDHMNEVGKRIKSAGMQFGYHNHSNEWKTIDGVLVYDAFVAKRRSQIGATTNGPRRNSLVGARSGQISRRESRPVLFSSPQRCQIRAGRWLSRTWSRRH